MLFAWTSRLETERQLPLSPCSDMARAEVPVPGLQIQDHRSARRQRLRAVGMSCHWSLVFLPLPGGRLSKKWRESARALKPSPPRIGRLPEERKPVVLLPSGTPLWIWCLLAWLSLGTLSIRDPPMVLPELDSVRSFSSLPTRPAWAVTGTRTPRNVVTLATSKCAVPLVEHAHEPA